MARPLTSFEKFDFEVGAEGDEAAPEGAGTNVVHLHYMEGVSGPWMIENGNSHATAHSLSYYWGVWPRQRRRGQENLLFLSSMGPWRPE